MAKPEIRLKGFEGEWKNKKIGELSDILTGYPFEGSSIKKNGKYLLMRGINITEGYIRHSDDIDRYYDGDINLLTKYILDTNDLVIGMDGSKVGKNSALVTDFEKGSLLVQRVARLRNSSTNVIRLIQIALRSSKFIQYVEENKTSSAIPHISPSDIYNFEISISDNANEQKWVADYFKSLDSMIQGVTKKIASLKQMKSASLISMFPQAGETKPRVRFKGFEKDWEKKCFGELYYQNVVKNDMTYGTDKIISVANMYYNPNTLISDVNYLRTYNIFRLGDISFEGNKSKNFAHGRFVENTIGDGIVSHVFDVFTPKIDKHDLNYWKYAINDERIMGKILVRCTKASTMMTNLVAKDFLKEFILVPSYEEQKQIGSFFANLDRQISLQEQRLEKLKQIKSACLDKMFV